MDTAPAVGLRALVVRLLQALRTVLQILLRAGPRESMAILGAQLLSGIATTGALLLTTQVLARLLESGPTSDRVVAALPSLLLLCVVHLARMGMDAAALMAKARLVPCVHRLAEEDLFRASVHVDLVSFDSPGFYDQLHRARDRGVMHIEGATSCLVEMASALVAVVAATVALAWLHPALLLLVVALLPEGWAALSASRLQYAGMATTIALTRQTQMLGELATRRECAPEIRANQAQDYVMNEYRRCADELQEHLVAIGVAEARTLTIGRLCSGIGIVATFVMLGLMLHAQWLELAVAGTAVIAIRSASQSLARLMQAANELFEKALYIGDYREFLDQAGQRRRPTEGIAAPDVPDQIEMDRVSFQYPGAQGRTALRDISLSIQAGQTIALVGENGSGKTTLARLIAGLYHPTSGRITWDGIDLATMSADSLADRIVMVQQDPVRWPRNAGDNIRVGRHTRHDPDDAALLRAAQESRALEVIQTLPQGWDTILSKEFRGGEDLSGGQWQRLAVARGLYREAPLVIWDEPTAPLDARAEHAVYESLRKLSRDRTVILITHRLASIRNVDRIFFLERGELVEQGRHDELMALGGRYADLYRLQIRLHGLDDADA